MKKYLEFAKIWFKAEIIYRFDLAMTIAEVIGRVMFAWLIWGAVFIGRDTVGGFSFEAMLLYYIVASFIATLDICGGVSGEISHEIRNGNFSKFMVIPVNTQLYWLAQNLGVVSLRVVFVLPAAFVCALLFGAGGGIGSFSAILLGLALIPVGLAFMVTYHYFIGLLAFKFQDVWVFIMVQFTAVEFSKGALLPLNLLPETMFNVIRFLPFPHMVFTPAMLFIGRMDLREGLYSLGILLLWLIGMTVVAQITYGRLRVKYDGVGI